MPLGQGKGAGAFLKEEHPKASPCEPPRAPGPWDQPHTLQMPLQAPQSTCMGLLLAPKQHDITAVYTPKPKAGTWSLTLSLPTGALLNHSLSGFKGK